MNTRFRSSQFVRLFVATTATALLLVRVTSQAQTVFGSVSSTNYAPQGVYNLAMGYLALCHNTTGYDNTAMGYLALYSNTTGYLNTANGLQALYSNTSGYNNTAIGYEALVQNGTGYNNTANGAFALWSNTTANWNTAYGSQALFNNVTGTQNTANGGQALSENTTGNQNTANGFETLEFNTTGNANTANGVVALENNTTGSENTAVGQTALISNTSGNYNIALGFGAGSNLTTGSNNIAIGNPGSRGNSGVIRIGTKGVHNYTFIAGIYPTTQSTGFPVYITSSGQLYTYGASSRRFKNDIKEMGHLSDKLMNLRPVTFRYNDATEHGPHALQYGLIAEEVAKVYPDLVEYDKARKPCGVYYHLLTPMLLNELQKEHRQNVAMRAAQKATQAETASLEATLHAQNAELAALKQSQQQQLAALAKLTSLVQTTQNRTTMASAAYTQR